MIKDNQKRLNHFHVVLSLHAPTHLRGLSSMERRGLM